MTKNKLPVYLSVIIPAYNESRNLKKGVLEEVDSYLAKQTFTWEVLVVDDGSTDNTTDIVSKFVKSHNQWKLIKEPHRGKGGTVIAGMLLAKGEIVVFTDMDQATPLSQIEHFFPLFDKGYDIVIGSRNGRKGANLIRKTMAYGFAVLRTLILRLPFRDTQCGFKAFKSAAISPVFERMQVFRSKQQISGSAVTAGFDLELLYIARKLGFKIAEKQVEWQEKGDRGDFGVNPLKDSWDGLRDLLKVRINAFKGDYKL
jgi:dolichyl-phosphate beta-glucosyltransferase